MKDVDVYNRMKANQPIYMAFGFMGQFFVAPVEVERVTCAPPCQAVLFTVTNPLTGKSEDVHANLLFDDEAQAQEFCRKQQQEHGRVTITQKEYDEYQMLKAQTQPPQEG